MKESTSILRKIRSSACRRLFLDEARRWIGVACLLTLLMRVDFVFLSGGSSNVKILWIFSLLFYTATRVKSLRSRVPTLYQTARRLETNDAEIQGVLSAALEFESTSSQTKLDSGSLRDAVVSHARLWLERAVAEGRLCELRNLALRRTPNIWRNRRAFLERVGASSAALLLLVHFIYFPSYEKKPEKTSQNPTTTRNSETSSVSTPNLNTENASPTQDIRTIDDEFSFLRATIARNVSLLDSLTKELDGASFDSFDSTLVFQLIREFDSAFASLSGLIASVGKFRAFLTRQRFGEVENVLLIQRLNEFDDYLNQNQDVGAELTRLFGTTTRSFSRDVQKDAFEHALETARVTKERLQNEERALDFLAFGLEFPRKFAEIEEERAALLQEAIARLQQRPGAPVDGIELTTNEFLVRLDGFRELWKARRDELVEIARRLREPESQDFIDFATRFAERTDSYAFLFGVLKTQVDLERRFERSELLTRQIEQNARAERWGKAASSLSEASNARDMLGDETRESTDRSSTLAWRLAFGTFNGINAESSDAISQNECTETRAFEKESELKVEASLEDAQETLERMAREGATASKPTKFSGKTQTAEEIRNSFHVALESNQTSDGKNAPDENFAGGFGARETNAPSPNTTDAFLGELPNVASGRLATSKSWNPPLEYQKKERAFQARLRAETRKIQSCQN